MKNITKMAKALKYMRETLGEKTVPMYWIEFLLLVSESGDKGVTTHEISKYVDMTQGIASRAVKKMSTYYDPATKEMCGMDLLKSGQDDPLFRQRQVVYLTEKGKQVIAQVNKILS